MASKFEQDEISRHLFGKECEAPAFFALYNDLVRKQGDFIVNVSVNGNKSIDNYEVLLAIDLLKRSILITKDEFFNDLNKRLRSERPASDIHSIINVAVQTMVMVDANAKDRHAAGFAVGKYRPTSWLAKETFLQFMERTLRATESSMAYQNLERSNEVASALKAWKLQKRLGAHFLGTTNLSEHLLLDEQTNCIYLFHHVGFLEAHLDKAQDHGHSLNQGMSDSLEVGTLPYQLLVETLHSIQYLLFQPTDTKSTQILDDLINKKEDGFDPKCIEYKSHNIFQELPEDFKYRYWGERVTELHKKVLSRPPRSKLERWLYQQSNDGNALFIALVALFISIIVGVISIGIGAVQIWIAWMAWKHPLTQSP